MGVMQILGAGGDGGAETYCVKLTTALHEIRPQSAALRAHPGREAILRDAGVSTRVFGFGGPLDLWTRLQIKHFARAQGATHLVAWMNRAARHTPKGPWARIGRMGGYYGLKYYRGFDALVGNTQDIVDHMVRGGAPAAHTHYIPNFADVAPCPAEAKSDHGTPEDAPVLLAPGRLHSAKAHDVAISALVDVPQAHLWIVGTGPLEASLRMLANRLGVGDRVKFLGWRADMGALYAACDLVVFPSRFEPLGNVVIEAWSVGKPIVATRSQGPGALIADGVDGCLVPVDETRALSRAIREALESPDQCAQWVGAGLKRAKAFSKPVVVAQWLDLFDRMERR
jgi:glycosyltransferase involved in cell wall biosynthesis